MVGPNADEDGYVHLHYGPQATRSVTIYGGLKEALEGKADVVYARGCDWVDSRWPDSEIMGYEPTQEELGSIAEAVEVAKNADVAVVVLGGCLRTCGENRSRTSLDLPGCQDLLLKEIHRTGTPVVLVLVSGRPLSINWADRNIPAILEAWYPGTHGGTAVAEALLGEYNPGGKLSVTFPKTVGQIPFNFPYKPNSQIDGYVGEGPAGKQTRVGGALYDFGHGLSYTDFEYSDLVLSAGDIMPGDSVEVSFSVTNTGKYKGDEIPQLYIHDIASSITVYDRMLRGFERVTLEPGQTKRVSMLLTPESFTMLDRNMNEVIEPGIFEIYVGSSSTDIRLASEVTVKDPDHPDRIFRVTDSRLDGLLPASLKTGDSVTFPLDASRSFRKFDLVWRMDTDCTYEIQLNEGGGQFVTVMEMTSKGGSQKPRLPQDYNASDLRILVKKGHGTVTSFSCLAFAD